MILSKIDTQVVAIRDGENLSTQDEIVRVMKIYLEKLYSTSYTKKEIRDHIVWSINQYDINYSLDILNAFEATV